MTSPFVIQVYKDGQLLETYTDNNAAFYDRSYQMPTSSVQVYWDIVLFNMKQGGRTLVQAESSLLYTRPIHGIDDPAWKCRRIT